MHIIDIPTEQTTAVTDLILAIISVVAAFRIYKLGKQSHPEKTRIWFSVFILLTIAAFFGFMAHGFKMPERTNYLLWQPLNLALGLSVSMFAAGALHDLLNDRMHRLTIPLLLALGVIFYFITVFIPGSFLIFIIYEAVVMLFALGVYVILAMRKSIPGAHWMVAGILITIIAAVVQATGSAHLTLIWEFDFNGLFHLIQMVGIFVIFAGLKEDFSKDKS